MEISKETGLTDAQKEKLKKDIDIIVKLILELADSSPLAIVLCGGYGRGEGAWTTDAYGNVIPYNDYDLAVVSNKPFPAEKYEAIRKKIAEEVSIRWIDIDWYDPATIKKLSPTIKNYDLLNASSIIYGDRYIFENCRKINVSAIGEYDVITLYKTRIWTFLGSWKGDFCDLYGDDAIFFRNQMAKAVLAACDMILVKKHMYTPSYRDRVTAIAKMLQSDTQTVNLCNWALNEKLHPSSEELSEEMMRKLYWSAKKFFCDSMQDAMGDRSNYFSDPDLTKKYFYFHTRYIASDLFNKIVRKTGIAEKILDVFLAQNYVFLSNSNGVIDSGRLRKAADILSKWGYLETGTDDWNEVREIAAYARNNI